jgi:hypothetical protein
VDGERPPNSDGTPDAGRSPKAKSKLPSWAEAIPVLLNVEDQLEVVARLSFRSLAVALARVLADPFMKVAQRVQLITQINAQMVAVMDKRRIWLAEQVIRGNDRVIAETSAGPKMEMRDDATGANSTNQASRPTARRGRPRKQ